MSSLRLYGHPDSGHACKVALALALAELPHETIFVDIWKERQTRPQAFLALSPFAEVPVLQIDDEAFTQSGSILLEIASRFKVLGGETEEGLVRGREILFWEANRIGMCLPQLIAAKTYDSHLFSASVIDWLETRYAVDRARFDILLGTAPFLHGAAPGIGDCAVWGYVQWLDIAGVTPSEAMRRWSDRMGKLRGMQTAQDFFIPANLNA